MPRRSGGPRAASVPPGVGVVRALDWNHRAVKCVAFDPGLGKLAGGSLDGTISLWDTTEGKLLRTFEWRRSPFEWQRSEIASVAFDPAGACWPAAAPTGTSTFGTPTAANYCTPARDRAAVLRAWRFTRRGL